MSAKLLSKEEVDLLFLFQDSGNYGFECAYGAVNTEAPFLLVNVGEKTYMFDRASRDSPLYKEVQEELLAERVSILKSGSL